MCKQAFKTVSRVTAHVKDVYTIKWIRERKERYEMRIGYFIFYFLILDCLLNL